jgi:hypothetical protein
MVNFLFIFPLLVFSERYAIINQDTVSLENEFYLQKLINDDTILVKMCNSFILDSSNNKINEYKNCKEHGKWMTYNFDSSMFIVGSYINGKPHGIFSYMKSDGDTFEILYNQGLKMKKIRGSKVEEVFNNKIEVIWYRYQIIIAVVYLTLGFIRIFLNIYILRNIFQVDNMINPFKIQSYEILFKSFFIFYWRDKFLLNNPEYRTQIIYSNYLGVAFLVLFVIMFMISVLKNL